MSQRSRLRFPCPKTAFHPATKLDRKQTVQQTNLGIATYTVRNLLRIRDVGGTGCSEVALLQDERRKVDGVHESILGIFRQ